MEIQRPTQLGPRPAPSAQVVTLSRARRSLLELLDEHGPTTLSGLVTLSGLHENTVRGHLEGLAAEGLVSRRREAPHGRGRPAWVWRSRSGPSEEYAGLAAALARTLRRTSEHPEDDAIGAGHDWGRSLAAGRTSGSGDVADRPPSSQVRDLLDDLGFAPEGRIDGDAGELRLTRCPLLQAAEEEPGIVCNVHLGLVAGALEEFEAPDADAELLPFAEPGACVLRLRGGVR